MSDPKLTPEDVCRCGHYRELHYSGRYACQLRYEWSLDRRPRLDSYRGRPDSCASNCTRFRPARWIDEHSPWRHVIVPLWWALPARVRWRACEAFDRLTKERLCWCNMVDSALRADPDYREDYSGDWGCPCSFPMPWDAGTPYRCYCSDVRADR